MIHLSEIRRPSKSLRNSCNSNYLSRAALRSVCRLLLTFTILGGIGVAAFTRSIYSVGETLPCSVPRARINLAFILDSSGSLANFISPDSQEGTTSQGRGQTYNAQIKGAVRAMTDPGAIPRDGSVAVTVITFNSTATVRVPLTEITSYEDARSIVAALESLECDDADSQTGPCPSGPTNFTSAIDAARLQLRKREGACRVAILSSDGEPSRSIDPDFGAGASTTLRNEASKDLVQAELNVILMGLNPELTQRDSDGMSELERNIKKVEKIVFPSPTTELPGKFFVIDRGLCNFSNACRRFADCSSLVIGDCERQIAEFARITREILRSDIQPLCLTVDTNIDLANSSDSNDGSLSLRRAIELANCNGGSATITFAANVRGKTINLAAPLPALCMPDIIISGFARCGEAPSNTNALNPADTVTIDGNGKFSDGILIRSSHDVVRGLRIVGFQRSGIAIEPLSPNDNVGFNLVENNVLEGNVASGVCISDPPQVTPRAIDHNIGNTISANDIFGSETPIDLACDGMTPNDICDLDEGPNTLLNSPDSLVLDVTANPNEVAGLVTLNGQLNCSSPGGGTVEVFTVDRRSVMGKDLTDLIFRGKTFLDNGSFTIGDLPASPTGIYAASFTDLKGNTSELRITCSIPAKAVINTETFEFQVSDLRNINGLSLPFTITNPGCAELTNVIPGPNGRRFLTIIPQGPQASFPVRIGPNSRQDFTVLFNPVIPRFVSSPRFPEHLLQQNNDANLTLLTDAGVVSLRITARVRPRVYLIDSEGNLENPLVKLDRSGDLFVVTFYVYDSDPGDIQSARFEFFERSGKSIPVDNNEAKLTGVIEQAIRQADRKGRELRGRSWRVIQRFSNANQYKEAAFVRVTVIGRNSQEKAESNVSVFPAASSRLQTAYGTLDTTLVLPTLKFAKE
jgi:hypothetical protein